MQAQVQRYGWMLPLVVFIAAGLLIGISIGYLMWNPGFSNFGVVSSSKEATRTVRLDHISVTFPSVVFAKSGAESTLTIVLTNLRSEPIYATVSFALVRNSGIDSATVSALTSSSYSVRLASYASANDLINFKPSSTGYAFFDLIVNGDLAGTIPVYVVPT